MSTKTAPTYLYKDYVPQLIALLADVQAEAFGGGIRVGGPTGLVVYAEHYDVSGVVARVSVRTNPGFSRRGRGSRHIFRNVEQSHVAKNVRKILAEKVAERAAQKLAYEAQVTAENRAIEAGAQVRAVAERVGVSHVTVEEQGSDFRFGFRLENLTEAQALAVLAITEGAVPPAGPWSFQGRRIGTPGQVELIDSYRAQVDARLAREREDGGQ